MDQLKAFELPKELELWRPDGGPSEPRLAAVVRDEVPSAVDSAEPPSEFDPAPAALRALVPRDVPQSRSRQSVTASSDVHGRSLAVSTVS